MHLSGYHQTLEMILKGLTVVYLQVRATFVHKIVLFSYVPIISPFFGAKFCKSFILRKNFHEILQCKKCKLFRKFFCKILSSKKKRKVFCKILREKRSKARDPTSFLGFFISDGRHDNGKSNIRSTFFKQWVNASNIQLGLL